MALGDLTELSAQLSETGDIGSGPPFKQTGH
jgi:hypothetical protein